MDFFFCYQEINLKKSNSRYKNKNRFFENKNRTDFFISNMFFLNKKYVWFFLYQGFDFFYIKNSIF